MRKLFKTVDDKFREIGFEKVVDNNHAVTYERKNEVYHYTQCLDILYKTSGRHLVQSYDIDLSDEDNTGNVCVGLTYYELKLVMKKMRQKGWKTKLPLLYEEGMFV